MNSFFKNILPDSLAARIFWLSVIVIAFLFGWWTSDGNEGAPNNKITAEAGQASTWTCSMHPQIQLPGPGDCPICGMDLIPVSTGSAEDNSRSVKISPAARKLAEIEVATVERKYVENEIRLVGKVIIDETRLSYITAWVPGRIDRLFVNYTGIRVNKGDHLVELYSPELLSTRQELVESVKTVKAMGLSDYPEMLKSANKQLESVRERLRLWGLTDAQIAEMESGNFSPENFTLYSPVTGIVINQNALEGSYVQTGTRIFTIANLEKVWITLDAYESDLPWLHYGQEVSLAAESWPGEKFSGRISFIDPVLNPQTRTVKVRVNMENPGGKLKPQMFVHAVVRAKIAAGEKVVEEQLAGKWISPMHPEIIKDGPGNCDVCGMKLVRAEELGFVTADSLMNEAPLVIPASAPLITGKRAVVYVAVAGREGVYEGRDIELGPRAGDYYLVKSGLREGEKVVVKGNFKIDSAIQIKAGKSMMNPEGVAQSTGHQHGGPEGKKKTGENETMAAEPVARFDDISEKFLEQLDDVYQNYFEIQFSLSHDKFDPLRENLNKMGKSLQKVDMKLVQGDAHIFWMKAQSALRQAASQMQKAGDLAASRENFEALSKAIIQLGEGFGSARENLKIYHCPMAFNNRGADWLQNKEGVENPYFGSQMFKCGSKVADIKKAEAQTMHEGHDYE